MRKVAIISFFHSESSLCLAKYIARQNVQVDYYYITDILRDKGFVSGFEYLKARKKWGIVRLRKKDAPEIFEYTKSLPVKYSLIRIISFSKKLLFFNRLIFYLVSKTIKKRKYDAINIVGQHPWISFIHDGLKGENIIHTLHEVGNHENEHVTKSLLLDKIISDKSKVILHSRSIYERFLSISGVDSLYCKVIPFGKFETLLLYDKNIDLNISLDLSKPIFLFYGHIKPYKGLSLLKKACERLSDILMDFNLIIAGGGEDESLSYFKKMKNCTIINRFLTNEEMIQLNKIATVILLPYKSASQSGIPCTSFLYGKPIIATKVGAFTEIIRDGINGILTKSGDDLEFSNAMRTIIENRELLRKLESGVRLFGCNDEYDWNKLAKDTVAFYGI